MITDDRLVESRNYQEHRRCPEQVDLILSVMLMGLVDMLVAGGPLDVWDPDPMKTVEAVGAADDHHIFNGEGCSTLLKLTKENML